MDSGMGEWVGWVQCHGRNIPLILIFWFCRLIRYPLGSRGQEFADDLNRSISEGTLR